jgi:molybdopterin-guanine dinucleotide biosynthesis protein
MKMNILQTRRLVGVFALTATILMASGCGGSSSSSDGDADSTVVSRGLITGFGSVYVNGIRFHTGGTQFSIDDDSGVESDLRVGMIVTVKGSKNDDGVNGHATHISYDNELKGPVASIVYDTPDPANATMATMVILGQSNMELQADDSEIEIKGHIDDNSLTPNSFSIKGFPVSYDDTTELDDLSALANGLLVEVKGQLDGAGTTLIAREIEGEHEGLDGDMDDAEIQGAIYDFDFDKNTFKILDQRIDATGAELYPSTLILANDLVVEAEGHIIDGILYADEVKQKGKKIKVYATLSAVEADSVGADSISFNFNSADIITAQVNHQTELEDDITDTDIVLSDLSKGDFVEMEAFDDGSGVINAVEIERKNPDEIRIVAPVDGWDADAETVTLLGVVFNLRGASYENEFDQNISVETFYNSLSLGEFVKIKDTDSNGVFDKAELDD